MNTLRFNKLSAAEIHTFGLLESVAESTLQYLTHGFVGLSCGATYSALFPLWTQKKPDCSNATFFPADERCVPFDDPENNWGTTYRLFLDPVGKNNNRAHDALSAQQYNDLLNRHFTVMPPMFDVIFLGMGSDGHTAGLFPGTHHISDNNISVVETVSPKPPLQRISLSPAVLAAAKKLIVVITGTEKIDAVSGLLSSDNSLPIVQILSQRQNSVIYIEQQLYTAAQRNNMG